MCSYFTQIPLTASWLLLPMYFKGLLYCAFQNILIFNILLHNLCTIFWFRVNFFVHTICTNAQWKKKIRMIHMYDTIVSSSLFLRVSLDFVYSCNPVKAQRDCKVFVFFKLCILYFNVGICEYLDWRDLSLIFLDLTTLLPPIFFLTLKPCALFSLSPRLNPSPPWPQEPIYLLNQKYNNTWDVSFFFFEFQHGCWKWNEANPE